jgi:ABC-2 type transport system ATP-binding protein
VSVLDVVDLTVRDANARTMLERISFAVPAGESYALAGPPGVGKSILIEALLGLRPATSERRIVCGIDAAVHPLQARSHVTYVTGTGALLPALSVRRNVSWLLQLLGLRASPREIDRALRAAEVPDRHLAAPARSLPPSERLGVWLAIASLRKSAVVVLDDPARDFGVLAGERLAGMLEEFRGRGVTILLTCRDARLAATLARRVGVLDAGKKVAELTT